MSNHWLLTSLWRNQLLTSTFFNVCLSTGFKFPFRIAVTVLKRRNNVERLSMKVLDTEITILIITSN